MARNTADRMESTPPMTNPATMHFITKALGQFPPESLCFYLPQLVQGLRHDTTKMLQEYILLLCSRSILLTPQVEGTKTVIEREVFSPPLEASATEKMYALAREAAQQAGQLPGGRKKSRPGAGTPKRQGGTVCKPCFRLPF